MTKKTRNNQYLNQYTYAKGQDVILISFFFYNTRRVCVRLIVHVWYNRTVYYYYLVVTPNSIMRFVRKMHLW